ncbi:MAG: ABC transporter ATP-binding protein [bacterium]
MKETTSNTKATLAIFWRHCRSRWLQMAVIVLGVIAASSADLYKPFLYKGLFDIVGGQSEGNPFVIVAWIAVVAIAGWATWRVTMVTTTYFESAVMADLMETCFKYLSRHSYNFFNNNFAGSLVRRANRFPDAFEDLADQVIFNVLNLIVRLSIIFAVLFIHYRVLAGLLAIWAILYTIANYWFAQYKFKFNVARAEADSAVTGHLADVVGNSINLKLFNGYSQEETAFGKLNRALLAMRRFTWNLDQVAEATQGLLMIILEFAVLWFALTLWKEGRLTVGDFALLQAYLLQIFDQLWGLGRNIHRIYRSLSDAAEMTDILLMPHEVADPAGAGQLAVSQGIVEFKDVSFGYDKEQPILGGFNLAIKPHEKVALVGPSGGGKSTIVKLILRFFDIQKGHILIDGQDIATHSQDSLRSQVALVPQEPILFHRSLLENIRYAKPDASDEEVIEAAKLAHCHEFISKFPEGYGTFVGERGVKLSGGERQRVAIARAILKDAPILVLDEATSSLDSESERYIQDALAKLMKDKTTIVIAHRLSTIMQMDRILVLEGGKITEEGRHEELVKATQGTYQKLWQIQAGGFEGATA